MRVGRRYKFRAQHHVEGLPEPWGSPHWHDYIVEVIHEGAPTNRLVDHEAMDELGVQLVNVCDGANLNERWESTTVESLAQHLRIWFAHYKPTEITVWEDDDRWATA